MSGSTSNSYCTVGGNFRQMFGAARGVGASVGRGSLHTTLSVVRSRSLAPDRSLIRTNIYPRVAEVGTTDLPI